MICQCCREIDVDRKLCRTCERFVCFFCCALHGPPRRGASGAATGIGNEVLELLITSAAFGGVAGFVLMGLTIQFTEWIVRLTGVNGHIVALSLSVVLGASVALIIAYTLSTACYCIDSGPIE